MGQVLAAMRCPGPHSQESSQRQPRSHEEAALRCGVSTDAAGRHGDHHSLPKPQPAYMGMLHLWCINPPSASPRGSR